ncbi:DNA repair protein RecO [Flavobacteriaceae bacterium S356]|uniref:DNA repair protein RecO n=1 Tax=Asprobacillus argus TaxID=3076534 RepID=A0ABU3LC16_9FLAO|nr:DNA repair protein RecO [Flavobacteriaceae bacterium S356]
MALLTTKAIVIGVIKYSDTSLIAKLYTESDGLKSYMLKGILKSKKGKLKPAYFQPLTLLNITASHNAKGRLNTIRDTHVQYPSISIYKNVIKQSIVLFLSEILSSSIQEEEPNPRLYEFLENAIYWLDNHDKVSNFHLLFLLNLTKFLGFYPDVSDNGKNGFNLIEGIFTDLTNANDTISGEKLIQFKRLLGIDFDSVENILFHKSERQLILQIIIRYFELHLDGFKKPKSLNILEAVFS